MASSPPTDASSSGPIPLPRHWGVGEMYVSCSQVGGVERSRCSAPPRGLVITPWIEKFTTVARVWRSDVCACVASTRRNRSMGSLRQCFTSVRSSTCFSLRPMLTRKTRCLQSTCRAWYE